MALCPFTKELSISEGGGGFALCRAPSPAVVGDAGGEVADEGQDVHGRRHLTVSLSEQGCISVVNFEKMLNADGCVAIEATGGRVYCIYRVNIKSSSSGMYLVTQSF